MGARTDAARQEALAARTALDVEVARLQAAARDAVDVRAQVRRHPGKAAGAAAGAAFMAVGGPKRVFRAVKRRVRGEPEPLPASLLPGEIEKAVSALGPDGVKVRGAIERSFRHYLDATSKDRKRRRASVLSCAWPGKWSFRWPPWPRGRRSRGRWPRRTAMPRRAAPPIRRRPPRRARSAGSRASGAGAARLASRASGGMADAPALGAILALLNASRLAADACDPELYAPHALR